MSWENWKIVKLKEVAPLKYGKTLKDDERSGEGYPVYGSNGIVGFHKKALINGHGIIVGRKGSAGRVQYSKSSFFPIDTTFYIDFTEEDLRYIAYFLPLLKLETFNSDSAVPGLNRDTAHSLKFPIPPLPTQRKIAAILSAYDDLIENNRKRIALLEQMATGLYKEWFVRWRVNGVELEKDQDTGLPVGWEVEKLGEVLEVTGGGTPSTEIKEYWDGDINWYSPTDITGANSLFLEQSTDKITELGLKKSSARLFPPFSVMMTSRATIGAIGINTTIACTNQGFIVCIPNEQLPFTFLYFVLAQYKELFCAIATGATFAELSKSVFKKTEVLLPPVELRLDFHNHVEPSFRQIRNLQLQNSKLRTTRDRLLPRLMSGELSVEHLPEVAGE